MRRTLRWLLTRFPNWHRSLYGPGVSLYWDAEIEAVFATLRADLNLPTDADVIKYAIALLASVNEATLAGSTLVMLDPDGAIRRLDLTWRAPKKEM